jgi:hypothetical protein
MEECIERAKTHLLARQAAGQDPMPRGTLRSPEQNEFASPTRKGFELIE